MERPGLSMAGHVSLGVARLQTKQMMLYRKVKAKSFLQGRPMMCSPVSSPPPVVRDKTNQDAAQ